MTEVPAPAASVRRPMPGTGFVDPASMASVCSRLLAEGFLRNIQNDIERLQVLVLSSREGEASILAQSRDGFNDVYYVKVEGETVLRRRVVAWLVPVLGFLSWGSFEGMRLAYDAGYRIMGVGMEVMSTSTMFGTLVAAAFAVPLWRSIVTGRIGRHAARTILARHDVRKKTVAAALYGDRIETIEARTGMLVSYHFVPTDTVRNTRDAVTILSRGGEVRMSVPWPIVLDMDLMPTGDDPLEILADAIRNI
jgi:hypothetical protein